MEGGVQITSTVIKCLPCSAICSCHSAPRPARILCWRGVCGGEVVCEESEQGVGLPEAGFHPSVCPHHSLVTGASPDLHQHQLPLFITIIKSICLFQHWPVSNYHCWLGLVRGTGVGIVRKGGTPQGKPTNQSSDHCQGGTADSRRNSDTNKPVPPMFFGDPVCCDGKVKNRSANFLQYSVWSCWQSRESRGSDPEVLSAPLLILRAVGQLICTSNYIPIYAVYPQPTILLTSFGM